MKQAAIVSRYILSLFFIVAGLNHFIMPHFYRAMMPPFIPHGDMMIVISGIAEVAGGIGLLLKRTRRWAALGLVLELVLIFPANIHMALDAYAREGYSLNTILLIYLRLPFQGVFILWTWWVCKE